MEKIKNATHLREQKMKLRVQELELEKLIRKDWSEIREKLQPEAMLKHDLSGNNHAHWLAKGLSLGISIFTKKMLEKAEEKLETKAEKGMEYLNKRLNKAFSTKK